MLKQIIISLFFSSALLVAQSGSIHGNLIRIPFDAAQINPADTVGSWSNGFDTLQHYNSYYMGAIHTTQNTYFEKYASYDGIYFLMTTLNLEDFNNSTSDSYGGWLGYYDITQPYLINKTISLKVENGTWLMNGLYNMTFISDNDEITILPRNYNGDLVYICGKINDKYLAVLQNDSLGIAYHFYLLDLSNSPAFDTTNAEKIYFDYPVAPYDIIPVSDSLYIAGADSIPYGGYGIYLFQLENNTFHFVKKFFNSIDQYWTYRNGTLFLYNYSDLVKYEYNPADTSFINETVIVSGGGLTINDDFTFTTQFSGDSLGIYNINTGQLINTIDISNLDSPRDPVIDSPYVYLHQKTFVTDVKDEPGKPLNYSLQVYPNPFNPVANVVYTIPERGLVKIKLFDVLGREVKEIFNGEAEAGNHTLVINGTDLSSGVYFVRFVTKNYTGTQKVLLLK